MASEAELWKQRLEKFRTTCRRKTPLPPRETLSEEEEWQCRYIGGSLIDWVESETDSLFGQRQLFQQMRGFAPDPVVVFMTTMPGLVAADEILGKSSRIIALLDTEFGRWIKRHPDPHYTWHIEQWNFFTERLDPWLRQKAQAAFPNVAVEQFRLHAIGTAWGELMGHEDEHLWQWDGSELKLLQSDFSQKIF